ncbi:hypothetical protein H8K52_20245 [Undibacterium seohonense]|uniref:Uncharacterized protein n=1 Tax=Undibacterium seohonense TaxID=1344950 RepID=A0ABR6XA08_9BURK|nr:hypothetical protein [Undibacterium seohonense]MBC3809670.1 hypothetical protein [Undibacterium seohonense]
MKSLTYRTTPTPVLDLLPSLIAPKTNRPLIAPKTNRPLGKRADMLVLDEQHPNLQDLPAVEVLNTWIFAGNDNLVRDVYVGGKQVVQAGQHVDQMRIQSEYVACMRELRRL